MNTIEAAESRLQALRRRQDQRALTLACAAASATTIPTEDAVPAGAAGNRGPAGGTAEELRRQVEHCQEKIDAGLARLVMVDKLTTAWGKAFSELATKAINGLKTYPDVMLTIHRGKRLSNAINALEEVREVEVNRIRELQHRRDALRNAAGNAGNTMNTGLEAGE